MSERSVTFHRIGLNEKDQNKKEVSIRHTIINNNLCAGRRLKCYSFFPDVTMKYYSRTLDLLEHQNATNYSGHSVMNINIAIAKNY